MHAPIAEVKARLCELVDRAETGETIVILRHGRPVGKLPCPDPRSWLDDALQGFEILPITEPIARQAALWPWPHRDPADRLIAATAERHGIELWHTDTLLNRLTGFPHRYFKAALR